MFDMVFNPEWSTMKKLIWLKATLLSGASAIIKTVTGTAPITLTNAISHAIISLTQTGKCVQDGTPTPDAPVDILCNNGELRYGKPLTLDPTRISAYINENGYWLYSSDSYSIAVPVEVGTKVAIRFTNTDSSVVGSIFRYGFRNNATPDAPTSATMLSQVYRGTPQEREYVELTADRPYLIIQLPSSRAAHILSSGYLVVSKQEIYTDGAPEVLTVSADGAETQTVTDIPMLLGVGDYKDEGELISGLLTHKIGIKVLNGTEDWSYSSGWSDTTHKCFYVEVDTIKQQTTVTNECLCSHLEWYSRDSFYADKTIVGGCVSGYIPTDPESGRALTVRVSSSIAETANDLKAWLAAQYAAGTPVIVVYPLATPTTEQTTPHALHTSAGSNIVSVAAEVSGISLAAQYKATE